MKFSKHQKWTLFFGLIGFFVLIIVADTVIFLLDMNYVISAATTTRLLPVMHNVLFILFMAFILYVLRGAEKRP